MAEPLIPFIHAPEIPLSFLEHIPLLGDHINPARPPSIKPFGTLVALGVYIGSVITVRHARERGLDERKMNEFILWILVGGFVSAHVLDAIFYHPDRVLRDPLYLIMLWDGLSSFGGFIGALSGAIAWRISRAEGILPFCEVVNSAFPLAWVFGRAGCASVHDHPGKLSDAWFAVRWPHGSGYVGRFDLGLIEMVLTIPLAIAFLILWHRKPVRPLGFYTGIMCVAYAPVRFFLDFLRESESTIAGGDPRYGGLTPAQWACFGLLGLGVYFLRMAMRGGSGGNTGRGGAIVARDAEVSRVSSPDDVDGEEPVAER
ncbi:prolipoprotein diacylglyceryl transferase [Chondromyces apiculatus]|uniref:Prolipoprotein diacylglyceryl transferase n=1 Tax=Chondromyces apiculatus DSM 436 TaxID=1192034 RepID=A0A017SZR6_9BACT|nr:prolipoprotein diacylglyceryl transferase family protein [Chondromyces apiculatus]EYF02060.1 Prolipoprotein diacylglyceryl transferase [Chondromyces apiculatus DSM 436]